MPHKTAMPHTIDLWHIHSTEHQRRRADTSLRPWPPRSDCMNYSGAINGVATVEQQQSTVSRSCLSQTVLTPQEQQRSSNRNERLRDWGSQSRWGFLRRCGAPSGSSLWTCSKIRAPVINLALSSLPLKTTPCSIKSQLTVQWHCDLLKTPDQISRGMICRGDTRILSWSSQCSLDCSTTLNSEYSYGSYVFECVFGDLALNLCEITPH